MAIWSYIKERKLNPVFLFVFFFVIRLLFAFASHINDHYSILEDGVWLVSLGDKIAEGDFNLDIGRFIASPAYPCFVAAHKIIFGSHWIFFLLLSQLTISSVSGIFFYRIARRLFPLAAANVAVLLFGIFLSRCIM